VGGAQHVAPVRKSLGVRTAFNILGPMLNPAVRAHTLRGFMCRLRQSGSARTARPLHSLQKAPFALVGVYSADLLTLMAESLQVRARTPVCTCPFHTDARTPPPKQQRLGIERALVVNSMGIDELTPCAPADIIEVTQQSMKRYTLHPSSLGMRTCTLEDLKGGDAAMNAQILRDAFAGKQGPIADALCLNAGVALAAAGIAASPAEGVAMAQEVQRAGKPAAVLDAWVARSQALLAEELRA
jgi:anthranilate phosphoribosyltransferase